MSILSGLYGRAAEWRRAWYGRHPHRRAQLDRPVISVGNLVVGGSGKTPTVASLARLLQQRGERPAILSRGYARRESADGVVVVSDGDRVLEPTARSGDEPQMLARALPGVPVLVARERFLAGRLAERRFDATVHLLDDGFQHLGLARDIDLLIVSRADLAEQVLPAGRLREPLVAARYAHALLVPGSLEDVREVAERLGIGDRGSGIREVFRIAPSYADLRPVRPGNVVPEAWGRVLAVAGIAHPERFFAALREQGCDVVREMAFRDHHWFSAADVKAIARALAESAADLIVTTEKDATRLFVPDLFYLPMTVAVEPRDGFIAWIAERLRAAREQRGIAA
ncbi:MAG TPA: tetraacyldisaccharide 4'-kinase [Vicinamibacterales bacterium]